MCGSRGGVKKQRVDGRVQKREASSGGYHPKKGEEGYKAGRASGGRKESRKGCKHKLTFASFTPGEGDWPIGAYRPCGVTRVGKREWQLKDGREESL